MKRNREKKTLNVQRPTLNAQMSWRVREESQEYGSQRAKPNEQRPDGGAKFDLEHRLLEYTARILKLVDALPNTRAANHIAGQLLRCGTSPYAHHGEAEAAESRKDFIHKLGVCFKELKEIKRWLRLIARVELVPAKRIRLLLLETEELLRIFAASIRTAEKNK